MYVQIGHDIYRSDIPRYLNDFIISPLVRIIAPLLGFKMQYPEYTTQ